MDEQLFLLVAKLKADRLKLEREKREQIAASTPAANDVEQRRESKVRGNRKFFSRYLWSEQS